MMWSSIQVVAMAMLLCLSAGSPGSAAELKITIDTLRNNEGAILLCVFSATSSQTTAYPDCMAGHPVRQGTAAITQGRAVVTYKGLADGFYAVAAIHDENGNGKLDTNFLNIPTEGVAISNNPRLLGKPKFEQARFEVKGNTAITVHATYLL